MSKNLILCGHKAVGKTFFGTLLSKKLKIPFIETDILLQKHYKELYGKASTCQEIWKELGEMEFRHLENQAINDLRETKNSVIALGAGTLLNPNNLLILERLGTLIYLEADKETIRKRILFGALPIPSYYDKNDPHNSFEEMYQKREKSYAKINGVTLKTKGKGEQQIVSELLSIYLKKSS